MHFCSIELLRYFERMLENKIVLYVWKITTMFVASKKISKGKYFFIIWD